MSSRFFLTLAAAVMLAGSLAVAPLASAQAPKNESAEQNVKESQAYERMLCSNSSFRAKRVVQECGPITDPQLHQSCVASFDCGKGRRPPNFRKAPPSQTIQ